MLDIFGKNKIANPLNEVLQHFVARRDKKGFLSNQWKEIEENNRMGKTRDLFKKIIETPREHFMQRYGMDLTEAEYTEELYKKIFMTQIIMKVWSLT